MQGAVAGLVLLAVLVIFAIVVVAKSVALIPQAEAAVIERLGRYSRTVSGQLTLLVPFIDRIGPGWICGSGWCRSRPSR